MNLALFIWTVGDAVAGILLFLIGLSVFGPWAIDKLEAWWRGRRK